jgi:hypothetical protein
LQGMALRQVSSFIRYPLDETFIAFSM